MPWRLERGRGRRARRPEPRGVRPAQQPTSQDDLDFLARINRRRRVFLTGTRLRGRFVLRACVLHLRTHADRIDAALEDVAAAAAEARES